MASAAVRAAVLAKASVKRSNTSAYVVFGNAMRESTPNISMTEIGAKWKALDTAAKVPYEELAAKAQAKTQDVEPQSWTLKLSNPDVLDRFVNKLASEAVKGFLLEQLQRADSSDAGSSDPVTLNSVGKVESSREEGGKKKHPPVIIKFTPSPSVAKA